MANAEFIFESKRWQTLLKSIEKKWDDIKNRRTFGAIISTVVYKNIIEHFEEEMGPDGKWTPWSASYIAAIQGRVAFRYFKGRIIPLGPHQMEEYGIKPARRGKMGKILQDTGRLRQSISPSKWRPNPEGIVFYNNAKTKSGFPYAQAHDDGGPNLPQRKFMYLSKKGMVKLITVVNTWLLEG